MHFVIIGALLFGLLEIIDIDIKPQYEFAELVEILDTPKKIGDWLCENIEYRYESIDYQQTPFETLELRTGDCEDYSVLAYYILKLQGYKGLDIIVVGNGEIKNEFLIGHSVCIFQDKEDFKYDYIDTAGFHNINADSVYEIAYRIDFDWYWLSHFDTYGNEIDCITRTEGLTEEDEEIILRNIINKELELQYIEIKESD